MSQKNILFEDNLLVTDIDKDGKVFEKVSRIEGIAEYTQVKITLDVNFEIYPITKDTLYSFLITKSLNSDGAPSPNTYNYDIYLKKNSLMEKYDYVVYGKIFKYTEEANGNISIYSSFGGLLLCLSGLPNAFSNLEIDDRIYLLMKKITK